MYETVEHLCRLLDQVTLVGVILEFFICQNKETHAAKISKTLTLFYTGNHHSTEALTWLQVKDHVQGLAIVRHLFIQTRQVELVLYVVFINL